MQVTIELTGRMLLGTEIGAALTALDAMRPDVIGINCATGPAEMGEHLRHLGQHSRMPIACLPNAGLPSVVDGKMHYDLTPDAAGRAPEPVRRASSACRSSAAAAAPPPSTSPPSSTRCRTSRPRRARSSTRPAPRRSTPTPFEQQLTFLVVGERTNANGSKKFREAMLDGDWDTSVAMAREQVKEGAHVLDVCVDYVGRDGTADMDEVASPLRHRRPPCR